MAYTVLARKYRSRNFDEVIGQEPIATTLVNAIKAGRIHHGYLFTGTRGVGKTSMARILAKALNCLRAEEPTTTPCCECDACTAIAEGQDLDVIEIDAASNTGVDNIRELRSNTAYRPARSRYKVYIIDEVHMLSTGAFNALLKTLEEPPEHVKFILATTELQKVPATIQSRCQCFNFRNIGLDDIAKRLAQIVTDEGAEAEPAVVRRVARLATGSMRDALSILDQLLSVAGDKLTIAALEEVLPPAQDEQVFKLFEHIAGGDAAATLGMTDEILATGRGLEVFCNDAIATVRALLHTRICGAEAEMVDVPAAAKDDYARLCQSFEESQYVQMVAMLEQLRRNVRYSGAGRALTDALMVRFARMREWAPIEQLLQGAAPAAVAAGQKKKPPPPRDVAAPPAARAVEPPAPVLNARSSAPPLPDTAPTRDNGHAPPPASRVPDNAATPPPETARPARDTAEPAPPPAVRSADAALRIQVNGEERARILQDPVVRQAMELFDGVVVDVARLQPAGAAADADATTDEPEDTE